MTVIKFFKAVKSKGNSTSSIETPHLSSGSIQAVLKQNINTYRQVPFSVGLSEQIGAGK